MFFFYLQINVFNIYGSRHLRLWMISSEIFVSRILT